MSIDDSRPRTPARSPPRPLSPPPSSAPRRRRGAHRYDTVRVADRPEARDRLERFLSVWEEQGCRMVPMSAEQHDAHAASSQFVTHLTGRMLGNLKLRYTRHDVTHRDPLS